MHYQTNKSRNSEEINAVKYETFSGCSLIKEAESENDFSPSQSHKSDESAIYPKALLSKEKLFYLAAILILKSGMLYLLEKANKSGSEFEEI